MNILVVAPHPDDEVLGAGGTIARHVADGDEVHVVILTRGNPEIFSEASIQQVRVEAEKAHKILGITATHFCDDFPAPGLDSVPQHKISAAIHSWLSRISPSVLYLPHRGDIHLDHRIVYYAAMVAARPGYSTIQKILCYETLSETGWSGPIPEEAFLPNVFVDISNYLEIKKAAMSEYRSQLKNFPNPRSLQGIDSLAKMRGATVQISDAEAFILIRDVLTH